MGELDVLVQTLLAIGGVLGGQKGLEIYRRKKLAKGNGEYELRKNSLSSSDKEFIKGCFDSMSKDLEIGRLGLARDITAAVQHEGEATRVVVRSLKP